MFHSPILFKNKPQTDSLTGVWNNLISAKIPLLYRLYKIFLFFQYTPGRYKLRSMIKYDIHSCKAYLSHKIVLVDNFIAYLSLLCSILFCLIRVSILDNTECLVYNDTSNIKCIDKRMQNSLLKKIYPLMSCRQLSATLSLHSKIYPFAFYKSLKLKTLCKEITPSATDYPARLQSSASL